MSDAKHAGATLTILALALEDKLPPSEERNRACAVVNMAIAASAIGLPWGDVSRGFDLAMEILERVRDGRPLGDDLDRTMRSAVGHWEIGPPQMRECVAKIRLAFIKNKHAKGN